MRALAVVAALFLSCQSGVTLDPGGSLQFPCTRKVADDRTSGNCPGDLFCGADGRCHSADAGEAYACRVDDDCGGGFRCGPAGVCLDPSADALRADAGAVTLSRMQIVPSTRTPWDAGFSAFAVGRTFYKLFGNGPLTDVSPIAVADGRDVYTVARSQAGFTGSQPPVQFFVGRAQLPVAAERVTDVAVARDQVFAIAGSRLFHYEWSPGGSPMMLIPLDAGAPRDAVGDRLRSGNSVFPLVFEFKTDAGHYRVFDSEIPDDLGVEGDVGGAVISDMADTDGKFVYAIVDGRVEIADRLPGFMSFGTFEIHSPGRLTLITNCGGGAAKVGENIIAKRLYVADNPNVEVVEQPLVAVSLDYYRGDAGSPYWMRLEPNLNLTCGGNRFRHVARGFCPACGEGEQLLDMQWGVDDDGVAALRAECTRPDAGPSSFYDLSTDSAGFSCFRKRRLDLLATGPITRRATSNPYVSGVASREIVMSRSNGLDDFTPLTLDRPPVFAHSYPTPAGSGLVAFGGRTVYRETPQLGMALHEVAERGAPSPAWVTRSWLLYDDGRVGLLTNLERNPQDAQIIAAPTRRDLKGPIVGTLLKAPNREFLVMTAFDTILAGDMTNASLAAPAVIEPKLVPEAEIQILSLAFRDKPSAAGVLAEGFLLTQTRVFLLTAEDEQRWTASQIVTPPGEWLEVWTDKERGRLGRRDGTVLSLPSGVPISRKLEGSRLVRDYQAFCGRSYALTADGLWRLDAVPDSVLGTWNRETELPMRDNWQTLYGAPTGDLWVFSKDGTAVLLKGAPCTP